MGNQGKISRWQSSKYTLFFIFPFWVSFRRRNFYCQRRNPFSVFTSISELIELGISLLVRVMVRDAFFVAWAAKTWSKHLILTVKKLCTHNIHSIDSKTLVNLEKRLLRILYVFRYQIWNQNGNMKKNVCFAALFPWNLALITHNAPSSVNPSINPFTPKSDLIDFTLSNARRFYSV